MVHHDTPPLYLIKATQETKIHWGMLKLDGTFTDFALPESYNVAKKDGAQKETVALTLTPSPSPTFTVTHFEGRRDIG